VLHAVLGGGLKSLCGWVYVKCHAINCRPAIGRTAGR
jgi:hypothetical protein